VPYGVLEHLGRRPVGRCRRWRVDGHGRHANLIASKKLVFGFDPAAIDPNLATAQQPIYPAPGHARQHIHQEIVDSLPGDILIDSDLSHRRANGISGFFCVHNDLFHVVGPTCCVILPTCE
jgi:hypothetical protein